MAEQIQKQYRGQSNEAQEYYDERAASHQQDLGRTALGDKLKQDLDDLLDEVDEVLVENAEEFVDSYVQSGGQ